MNKYYIMHLHNRELQGPYSFKKAVEEQDIWREFGVLTIILKEVVNTTGDVVK